MYNNLRPDLREAEIDVRDTCQGCPHVNSFLSDPRDWFSMDTSYVCTIAPKDIDGNPRMISVYSCWNTNKETLIPVWCPLGRKPQGDYFVKEDGK